MKVTARPKEREFLTVKEVANYSASNGARFIGWSPAGICTPFASGASFASKQSN